MTRASAGMPAKHQAGRRVVDQVDRMKGNLAVLVDGADAELAFSLSVTTERGSITASVGAARSVISAVIPAGTLPSPLGMATSMRKVRVCGEASRLM